MPWKECKPMEEGPFCAWRIQALCDGVDIAGNALFQADW